MASVDDGRDEWQGDEDEGEYEDVFVVDADVSAKLEVANRLHEVATRIGDVQMAQQRFDAANRVGMAANDVGQQMRQMQDIERQMQRVQDMIDPPLLRWFRQQDAMQAAFDLQRKMQQMQDFVDPPWQRQMREREAMFRRLNGLTRQGRWVRVRRPRRKEEPPPPTARKVEPEPEPRKTRGRPRKGNVQRLAQIEDLAQKVREYRQQYRGCDPIKSVAAERVQVRSASTIDNWLRDELHTSWKPWLASLV